MFFRRRKRWLGELPAEMILKDVTSVTQAVGEIRKPSGLHGNPSWRPPAGINHPVICVSTTLVNLCGDLVMKLFLRRIISFS